MNPQQIIQQAAIDGVSLTLSEIGTLKASGDTEAVKRWLPVIRQHKPRILATLKPGMSEEQEALIMRWIAYIGETDPLAIEDQLDKCRLEPEALAQCMEHIRVTMPGSMWRL